MFKFIAKKITLVPTTALTLAEETTKMWREGHAGEDNEDYWMPRYEAIIAEMMQAEYEPTEQEARQDALNDSYESDDEYYKYREDSEDADYYDRYQAKRQRVVTVEEDYELDDCYPF